MKHVEIKFQLDATDDFLLQILLLAQPVSGTTNQSTKYDRQHHLCNTLELLMMGIVLPETCCASNKICNKNHLLHLVGILYPNINDDARSKPHQIYYETRYHFPVATLCLH